MPSTDSLNYQLSIKIDSMELSTKDMNDVIELTVDTDAYLPAMFSFTLQDNLYHNQLEHADSKKFDLGKKVDISITVERLGKKNYQIFSGEITSLEPVFGNDFRPLLRVRGYDKAHRLTYGKKTRVFGSGTPGSIAEGDLFKKIGGEDGLSVSVKNADLSSLTYPYIMQCNQSDWDFLWDRARLYGCQMYVDFRGSLIVDKANAPRKLNGGGPTLNWGSELSSFEPRISLAGLASKSEVRGWDPKQKKEIVGQATTSTSTIEAKIGMASDGSAAIKKTIAEIPTAVVNHPVWVAGEAEKVAQAQLASRESNFVQADGSLEIGDPRVLAGEEVEIKNVGSNFSGKYFVTKARHEFHRGEYTVHFSVAGNSAHDLISMLTPENAVEPNKIYGPVIALVTNNNDPDQLGRVKVKFPWMVNGQNLESNWARVMGLGAGAERGFLIMPCVNDEVLVLFQQGDVNFPIVIGGLWNSKDKMPKGKASTVIGPQGKVNERVIRSATGHMVLFNDTQGSEGITIIDKTGNNSIIIDSAQGTMTIKVQKDLTIEAGGKIVIKSTGDTSIEAMNIAMKSSTGGMKVDMMKEIALNVTGGNKVAVAVAGVDVSGMKVSVSGTAMTEIKGALVKIN